MKWLYSGNALLDLNQSCTVCTFLKSEYPANSHSHNALQKVDFVWGQSGVGCVDELYLCVICLQWLAKKSLSLN